MFQSMTLLRWPFKPVLSVGLYNQPPLLGIYRGYSVYGCPRYVLFGTDFALKIQAFHLDNIQKTIWPSEECVSASPDVCVHICIVSKISMLFQNPEYHVFAVS